MENIKIKEILNIKEEKEAYTKAIITAITTKVSRQGVTYCFLEIADELRKITVCLSPEYFEQEIKIYLNKPITNDEQKPRYNINNSLELINFIKISSSMKIKCVMSKDMDTMNYFLCSTRKPNKMLFKYVTGTLNGGASSIIQDKESIKDIHSIENYKG